MSMVASSTAAPSVFAVGGAPAVGRWPVRQDIFAQPEAIPAPHEDIADAGHRPAGRLLIERLPLLHRHAGTPPDLLLKWNAMNAPAAVDVVVHLHGYSGRGAAMHIV